MIFLDTETCGLVGPIVLIQYQEDEPKPVLHEVWQEPVKKTLQLIERICDSDVCAFNLSYDWFHITRLYNVLKSLPDKFNPPKIEAFLKNNNRYNTHWCLKPKSALDLFLFTRKTKWQCLMDRRPITIRRVPTEIATHLARILATKIHFSDIFFKRRPHGYEWKVDVDEDDTEFADIKLIFGASGGLKPLCEELFATKTYDFPIPKKYWPVEKSYNPYYVEGWRAMLPVHIEWWRTNRNARVYAEQDVELLKRLHQYFGEPNCGDTDSELSVAVGAARWRGFAIDRERSATRYREKCITAKSTPTSPAEVKSYLRESCPFIRIKDTTKNTLEKLSKMDGPVGDKATQILEARKAEKEVQILKSLLETEQFCPDFKVIGAKSGRMSGGSDLGLSGGSINPQGIQHNPEFRALFILASNTDVLSGGDFKQFEVSIGDAVYNEPNLRRNLLAGKSVHGLFGEMLYEASYAKVMSTKGTENDLYYPAKHSFFGYLYGAQEYTLSRRAGVTEAKAKHTLQRLAEEYPRVVSVREAIFANFCTLKQPSGIGTEIICSEPKDSIASLLGYRRYFTLENYIIRSLFQLAQDAQQSLKEFSTFAGLVQRRQGRQQTKLGATQTALYAAAFNIQSQVMRAAANHVIQSTGAEINKEIQLKIWSLQPNGIHFWRVQTLNIHDENLVVHCPELSQTIQDNVLERVGDYRELIPLISMDWRQNVSDWSKLK